MCSFAQKALNKIKKKHKAISVMKNGLACKQQHNVWLLLFEKPFA